MTSEDCGFLKEGLIFNNTARRHINQITYSRRVNAIDVASSIEKCLSKTQRNKAWIRINSLERATQRQCSIPRNSREFSTKRKLQVDNITYGSCENLGSPFQISFSFLNVAIIHKSDFGGFIYWCQEVRFIKLTVETQ